MTSALTRTELDPHRVAPQIPLVLLPGTGTRITPWTVTRPSRLAAMGAHRALDRVVAAAAHPDRRVLGGHLPAAVTALGHLAATLARHEPLTPAADGDPTKLIHRYFGVRHSNTATSGCLALHATAVIRWCLADLEFAALDAADVLAEVAACHQVIADIAQAPRFREASRAHRPDLDAAAGLAEYLPDGDSWARWVVAHHGYLFANLLAAEEIDRATAILGGPRRYYGGAIEHLRRAAVQVRGLTAMMIHSAVLPGSLYVDEIRPTMEPGAITDLPTALTGGMFVEHHHYRRRLAELLETLPQPYDELVVHHPDLAAARSDLLNRDLDDLERHITMGTTLLLAETDEKSLVQRPGKSAVGELRKMRSRRVADYRPFLATGREQA